MKLLSKFAFFIAAASGAATAGAQTLYTPGATVGSSTNGNVGIETSSPNAKLDIQVSGVTVGLRLHNSISSTNWDLYAYNDNNFYLNNANGSVVNIFSNAAGGTLYIGGNRIGVDTLNMLRPFTVEAGSSGGVNQGLVINSAHSYGVGQGTASSALVFGRNRSFDTTALVSSAQIVGGNESETTSNNGFLSFFTVDGVGNLLERMHLDSGGNIGIGTTNPAAKLQINAGTPSPTPGQVTQALILEPAFTTYPTYPAQGAALLFSDQPGNSAAGVLTGHRIFGQQQGDNYANSNNLYFQRSIGNNTWSTDVIFDRYGNVGIGTMAPTQKLSVNGTVRAKEVIVDTNWSDYVFAKGYRLLSLFEVERHIQEQGHLPGVPSADEVAKKGVSIGDMQALLLAKIEELTLHQIAQEKRLAAQDAKIETQTAEIARLKAAIP